MKKNCVRPLNKSPLRICFRGFRTIPRIILAGIFLSSCIGSHNDEGADTLGPVPFLEKFIAEKKIKDLQREYSRLGAFRLEDLEEIGELDQLSRKLDLAIEESSIARAIKPRLRIPLERQTSLYDKANLRRLLELKPQGRWFRKGELSSRGFQAAFLIVQHGPVEIQESLIGELKLAAAEGLVNGEQIGLLTDRIEVRRGRPQIYGTQGSCIGQTLTFPELANKADVNRLRKEMGFQKTYEEYQQMLTARRVCN